MPTLADAEPWSEFQTCGHSIDLAVIVHGWEMVAAGMGHVIDLVKEALPDTDILAPAYDASRYSQEDPLGRTPPSGGAISGRP